MTTPNETLRTVILRPYHKGAGPTFYLATWDTGRLHPRGTPLLGYQLRQGVTVLFEGEDFSCSLMHAIDSDACLAALLGFLTVRPDDTDAEYFANYTDAQHAFCNQHAEALAYESVRRFSDE